VKTKVADNRRAGSPTGQHAEDDLGKPVDIDHVGAAPTAVPDSGSQANQIAHALASGEGKRGHPDGRLTERPIVVGEIPVPDL
jgi:hypothetical protein